ncbi:tetraacyldisaccharide 4'-kinase [Aureliella helgolandensis]|uniref:Tetraacyldisaccharide 4'-kinase n=1 Tax=Aureliella helgolandensis TaxID=2527968 RepID=A0A518GGH8_9BACT|nr:tetraacyldisaccharide 4'-kinase [Aureliella helgolandensis]QDV27658.1 Tetraacyldisaccharide 4'-kinase [Aureliella helgolandensis]
MPDLRQLLTDKNPGIGVILLRWLLRVLSIPYMLFMRGRNWLYASGWKSVYHSSLPVISVGNLSVGGTGKSPVVAWIAKWMRARNVRVAILSRGYGALDSGQNDEALELELQLPDVPHLQHWDRVASAHLAEEELEMELLLLDDGFQHRRISRELDIVLIDATEDAAARWPLPGGILRESMYALRRAQVVMLTRTDQVPAASLRQLSQTVMRIAPQVVLLHAVHQPRELWIYPDQRCPVTDLTGRRVLAFCAIGNPASFFKSVSDLGADVLETRTWPDHHGFEAQDIDAIREWAAGNPQAELLVCTMKDWVKLQVEQIGDIRLAALSIELGITHGAEQLESCLEQVLSQSSKGRV